jgi:hypothetical protein
MTSETFECRAFLVAWIALAEAGKKKAGRDGPRSGAAYTEGGQKRQGDGFPASKNRYSKINDLSMWFHDTTFFGAKYEAVNAKSLAGPPTKASNQPFGRYPLICHDGKENPSYVREPGSRRAANRAWQRLSEA